MATTLAIHARPYARRRNWSATIVTALPVLFLVFDGVIKLIVIDPVVTSFTELLRFVDDHRGLQAVVTPFASEMPRRQRVQLVVDQWHQPIERVLAAILSRLHSKSRRARRAGTNVVDTLQTTP